MPLINSNPFNPPLSHSQEETEGPKSLHMRKEIRKVEIEVEIYITTDGKEYKDFTLAKKHQAYLDGAKTCETCKGRGKIENDRGYMGYMGPDDPIEYLTCKKCRGKGYLEQVTVWQ
jgi:DnaJ-class molecular chaperone